MDFWHTNSMLIVFARSAIVFIFLLVIMRIMGKKQLGELQPFEFAIALIIADLATIPMADTTAPLSFGLIPIATLLILHVVITKISKKSVFFRKLVNGKPIIIIDENGIDQKALSKLDMTVSDILESIRELGHFSIQEIRYAIVETNGSVTVVPKVASQQATLGDLDIEKEEATLPYSVICEGKIMPQNLERSGMNNSKIEQIMRFFGISKKEVIVLTITDGEEIFIQTTKGAPKTAKFSEIPV